MLSFARVGIEISAEKDLPSSLKIKANTNKVIFIHLEFTLKLLICIDCQMFGHNKAGCESQLPKLKPKNNTITKENVENGEKSSSIPQQVLSQGMIDSGSNSLPANGSQGRPSTTIASNQDNRFVALANDTTDVDVQPSATILGDCVIAVETEANLLESPPVLVNKHHHMYKALVDTNEDEYPYAIDEEDSNEKGIESVFKDHIIPDTTNRVESISSQSAEVGYENIATTPSIHGDEWRTAVKPKKARKEKQRSPSGIDDPTITMMKKTSSMVRKKVKHLNGYIKDVWDDSMGLTFACIHCCSFFQDFEKTQRHILKDHLALVKQFAK
ncbi:hypothetical protein IFM89_031295 [Coptis chinensis]|uniref:Uncharacterized protein n=1 Tax=Coptis chinensis TaxID=261450 RepID=A0A835MB56_9MAGN|nr:hypothetical protein IFM89_031295 [Coptis chinensis]